MSPAPYLLFAVVGTIIGGGLTGLCLVVLWFAASVLGAWFAPRPRVHGRFLPEVLD